MNPMFYSARLALLAAAFLAVFVLTAQSGSRWHINVHGGAALYKGDIGMAGLGSLRGRTAIWGGGLHYQLSPSWTLGMEGHRGAWKGDDLWYPDDAYKQARRFRFATTFTDAAFMFRWMPLAGNSVRPFFNTGAGMVFYLPNPYLLDNTHLALADLLKEDLRADYVPAFFVPLRTGVQIRLTQALALDAAFQYNFTTTDYLDGVRAAGNPTNNDRYGQVLLGASFALGGHRDTDGDGIPDAADDCPFQVGSAAAQGCPDADGDGIPDDVDRCPYAKGHADMDGCPDTDGDGVPDPFDRCPSQPGPPEALGCPVQDSDGDGVADHLDDCPTVAGPANRRGCPAIDTDRDGLLDEDDTCPEQFGLRLFNGCPDTDGDGIEDIKDACPHHFGKFDNGGCPSFKSVAEEVRVLAQQSLYFRANSADVSNFALLDRLADFLRRQPRYRISIYGHADGAGGEDGPEYISQLRAERVKRYLVDSGIDEGRITARGYSGQHPLDTSGTAIGRAKNRRVGFALGE